MHVRYEIKYIQSPLKYRGSEKDEVSMGITSIPKSRARMWFQITKQTLCITETAGLERKQTSHRKYANIMVQI